MEMSQKGKWGIGFYKNEHLLQAKKPKRDQSPVSKL